ncbi:MAG: hypothetical protein J6W24_07955 [Prevotella sp.]|nr:hypothetical protein [Prevotella sp.]
MAVTKKYQLNSIRTKVQKWAPPLENGTTALNYFALLHGWTLARQG